MAEVVNAGHTSNDAGNVSGRNRLPRRARFLAFAVASLIFTGSTSWGTEISEPAFGFSYPRWQASFPKINIENLGTACSNEARKHFLIDGKFVPRLYLYGDYRTASVRLSIVGDIQGTSIFVQRGRSCAVGPVVMTFWQRRNHPPAPSDPPYLSEQEIEGAFSDLMLRYAAAFGGRSKFFAWLDPLTQYEMERCKGMSHVYCHPTWHDLPPKLQALLVDFRYARNR